MSLVCEGGIFNSGLGFGRSGSFVAMPKLSADLDFHRFENWYQLSGRIRRTVEQLARPVHPSGEVLGTVLARLSELPPLALRCVVKPCASDGHEIVHVNNPVAHGCLGIRWYLEARLMVGMAW